MPGGLSADFSFSYSKNENLRSFGSGGALKNLPTQLKKLEQNLRHKALKMIISDLAARVPKPVSEAVSEKYAVGKLTAIKRRMPSDGRRQKVTKRGNTTVRVHYDGDEGWIEFSGSHYNDWPVWANKQKKIPLGRKNRKGIRVRKPYKVFREIIKGKRVTITANDPTRIFVQGETGHLRVLAITPPSEQPLLLGSTSIPQAVAQPRTVKVWAPTVNKLVKNRVEHVLDYLSKQKK